MGTADHNPATGSSSNAQGPAGAPPVSPGAETRASAGRAGGRVLALGLLGGLVAGALAWGVGEFEESISPFWSAPKYPGVTNFVAPAGLLPTNPDAEKAITPEQRRMTILKHSAIAYGSQGAVLGLVLGVAGGLSRRSWPRALGAGIIGLLLGVLVGGGGSYRLIPYLNAHSTDAMGDDLMLAFQTHLAGWLPVGLVGGLAFALGVGGPPKVFVGTVVWGTLGAILGTILYETIGALAFPMTDPSRPIPQGSAVRLMACLLLAVAVGACAGFGARQRPPKTSTAAA